MIAEVFLLVKGPLDGASFHLERSEPYGVDCAIVPEGQEALWQVASFDEGGAYIRFLIGALESTAWLIYQYKLDEEQPGRYICAGILLRGDGRSKTKDVIARLRGEVRDE